MIEVGGNNRTKPSFTIDIFEKHNQYIEQDNYLGTYFNMFVLKVIKVM